MINRIAPIHTAQVPRDKLHVRRNIPREIRSIVPAVVREDLTAAGLMIVEYRTVKVAQQRLEVLIADLCAQPQSRVAQRCMVRAQETLVMLDTILESFDAS